jgi:serine/threonine-protein kinase
MPDLPRVGEEFGNYRLGARLSNGGMSVVFQAEYLRLGNVVALKILAPHLANDDTFRSRFLQEAQIAAGFNHPHVVPIIDSGAYDGLLYIAMRYVAGTSLQQMISGQHRLDPGSAVYLLSQAALALDAAHRRGMVHRDVKPANLLVERTSDDADPDHLYLADFGITKFVDGPGRFGRLTTAGTIMGTVPYLAPEQARELAVGGAADQYALGCVLYECLTGRAPFGKGPVRATMIAHVEQPPPPATMFRSDLPPAIDAVFARVLAKDPGQRYPTCRAFMAAAGEALGISVRLPGGGRSPQFQPAPLPPAVFAGPARDQAGQQYAATEDLTGAEPVNHAGHGDGAGDRAGAGVRSFYSADGGGDVAAGPPRRRQVRGYRQSRTRMIGLGLAVLAVVGTGTGWVLAAQPFKGKAPTALHPAAATTPSAAASSSAAALPASQLAAVLEQTATRVPSGDLSLSACREPSPTDLECRLPSPAIKSVSFVTFPTLAVLYRHYEDIVYNLTEHEPFAEVENKGECGGQAPAPPAADAEPTDENTWNLVNDSTTTYTAGQMAQGPVPVNAAMGRVFCEQMKNGSEYIVWTQDSGKFLGYATGAEPQGQVYTWWHYVHHEVFFPNQPGMPTSPGPATATSSPR